MFWSNPKKPFCEMCGARNGDFWQTHPHRKILLSLKTKLGDFSRCWTVCDECDEGLSSTKGFYHDVTPSDPDPFYPGRTVWLTMGHIIDKSKGGKDIPSNLRAVCTNCNEGLQNASLPKPDQIWLLAQVRRAAIDDQRAVLDWLKRKFSSGA